MSRAWQEFLHAAVKCPAAGLWMLLRARRHECKLSAPGSTVRPPRRDFIIRRPLVSHSCRVAAINPKFRAHLCEFPLFPLSIEAFLHLRLLVVQNNLCRRGRHSVTVVQDQSWGRRHLTGGVRAQGRRTRYRPQTLKPERWSTAFLAS